MLVLARKEREGVVIHQNGKIIGRFIYLERRGGSARMSSRFGFDFGQDYEIDRDEIFRKRFPNVPLPNLTEEE